VTRIPTRGGTAIYGRLEVRDWIVGRGIRARGVDIDENVLNLALVIILEMLLHIWVFLTKASMTTAQ
jgi:hypothetical protein